MKEATESIVKHLLTYILLLMLEGVCLAQTSLSVSDLSVPTKIARPISVRTPSLCRT